MGNVFCAFILLVLTENITDIPGKVIKLRGNIRVGNFHRLHLFLVQIIFPFWPAYLTQIMLGKTELTTFSTLKDIN